MQRCPLYSTALLFVLLPLLVIGCKNEATTPEVKIIEVRVSPGEVQAGYISELVCVFSDSLSDGYEFRWEISGVSGGRLDTTTSVNTLFVKSSSEEGVYNNSVQVFREEEEITPRFDFTLTVVERNWKPEDPFYEEADLLYSKFDGMYLMDTGTKETRYLTEGGAGTWSPEGDRIAFGQQRPMNNNFVIYTMYADGSNKKMITFDKTSDGYFVESSRENNSPIWSPNGRKIAYSRCWNCEFANRRQDVIIAGVIGEYEQNLVTNNQYRNQSIGWFKEGSKLLINSEINDDGRLGHINDVYSINTDGTGKKFLIDSSEHPKCEFSLSPDSESVVYACGKDEELYIENLITKEVNQLTDNDMWERQPSWLPDGSGIVFVMGSGTFSPLSRGNIFKILKDGTGLEKLTEKWDQYYGPQVRLSRN